MKGNCDKTLFMCIVDDLSYFFLMGNVDVFADTSSPNPLHLALYISTITSSAYGVSFTIQNGINLTPDIS